MVGVAFWKANTLHPHQLESRAQDCFTNLFMKLFAHSEWIYVTVVLPFTVGDSRSPFFVEYFFRFIIAKVLDSMREMELYMERECTDLDFTVVRPPGLTNNPLTGELFDCHSHREEWQTITDIETLSRIYLCTNLYLGVRVVQLDELMATNLLVLGSSPNCDTFGKLWTLTCCVCSYQEP